ncbi:hypothetical protein [Streptomyces canus]|nr:hypothetical protein [Streptomyces canus]WSD83093.1 hypothetical protein OG925_01485 [Streptomyces canus]
MSTADVAEVQEGLAGVHGEIGFGYPGAPGIVRLPIAVTCVTRAT